MSQHIRHAHPRAQNDARLAALANSKPSKLWSQEEILLLAELEKLYENKRNINALMVPHFTNKNRKQIAEKRRDRRDKRKKQAIDAEQSSNNSDNDANDEPETSESTTKERRKDFINKKRAPKITKFSELNDRITEAQRYSKNVQHHEAALVLLEEIVSYISENTGDINPRPVPSNEQPIESGTEHMNSAEVEQPSTPTNNKISKKDIRNKNLNKSHRIRYAKAKGSYKKYQAMFKKDKKRLPE
ncbi:hypothetical protein NDU88_007702 [Pleurodeles waltl]|uniref:Uncharacterized protein n=1 Tax=Pleurodeles waltl TaxID=8319 RepID=A0AAV7N503_PLEWA|nr:hypothetical protein NDU88_007702 [Pleurodeles waltl]